MLWRTKPRNRNIATPNFAVGRVFLRAGEPDFEVEVGEEEIPVVLELAVVEAGTRCGKRVPLVFPLVTDSSSVEPGISRKPLSMVITVTSMPLVDTVTVVLSVGKGQVVAILSGG